MKNQLPFFREAGAGPGVVCIHSNASSSSQWRGLMDRLSGRFRVFAPDSLGAGKSPPWHITQRINLAVVAKSPLSRLLALARARGWHSLPLMSTHGNTYDRDYFGDSTALPATVLKQQKFKNGKEWDMPMLNVFHRRGKKIRHFWGSEMLCVPPEPGQEYRHNDALDSLWNILDLTPEGRGDFHPQLSYPSNISKEKTHDKKL